MPKMLYVQHFWKKHPLRKEQPFSGGQSKKNEQNLLRLPVIYGSVSAGREFWPFRVIFFQKVERSCGQTIKDRFDFSIDLGQLCL